MWKIWKQGTILKFIDFFRDLCTLCTFYSHWNQKNLVITLDLKLTLGIKLAAVIREYKNV